MSLKADVIVPVHGNPDGVRRCLDSLLSEADPAIGRILVLDAASPDVATPALLAQYVASGRIELVRQESNQGFVRTVNLGMQRTARDVVLLNSDTEVHGNWLSRMLACLYADERCATVTPLSNNATLCTYPWLEAPPVLPEGCTLASLDSLCARVNAGRSAVIPTGVGFCLLIRRRVIEAIGVFDAQAFGRGYGEENDFCQRARLAGWHHRACGDTFVYHAGGESFGAQKNALVERAEAILGQRYPDYAQRVRDFIVQDGLRALREPLHLARAGQGGVHLAAVMRERAAEQAWLAGWLAGVLGYGAQSGEPPEQGAPVTQPLKPPVPHPSEAPVPIPAEHMSAAGVCLHVAHGWGGGIDRWIADFTHTDPHAAFILRSHGSQAAFGEELRLFWAGAPDAPLIAWKLRQPIRVLDAGHAEYRDIVHGLVNALGVERIIVSSLIGHALDVLDCSCPTTVVFHDYFPYCAGIVLHFGEVCRQCDSVRLAECLQHNPVHPFHCMTDAGQWRALREAWMQRMQRKDLSLVCPDASVPEHLRQVDVRFASLVFHVVPHGFDGFGRRSNCMPPQPVGQSACLVARDLRKSQPPLRVLVLGRLNPHKGQALLRQVLERLQPDAFQFYLYGCGVYGEAFEGLPCVVERVPDYQHESLPDRLAQLAPDCALLASTWPETFSYTLSEVSLLGIPPVVTALGAFNSRVTHGRTGFLCAPDADAIQAQLERLRSEPALLEAVRNTLQRHAHRSVQEMVSDYAALGASAHGSSLAETRPSAWLQAVLGELIESRSRTGQLQGQLQHVRAELTGLNAELHAGKEREARLSEALALIHRSRSWRLTAGLRGLAGQVRRGRQYARCVLGRLLRSERTR